jgi:hypothetical protein
MIYTATREEIEPRQGFIRKWRLKHGGISAEGRTVCGLIRRLNSSWERSMAFLVHALSTTPWTATLTYAPGGERVSESVCADKPHEYYNNKDWDVPKAEKPDF